MLQVPAAFTCHECAAGKGFNSTSAECVSCPYPQYNDVTTHNAACADQACPAGQGVKSDDGTSVRLGESVERPDYNKIAELLDANGVRPKYTRDLGQGKPLTQDLITTMY